MGNAGFISSTEWSLGQKPSTVYETTRFHQALRYRIEEQGRAKSFSYGYGIRIEGFGNLLVCIVQGFLDMPGFFSHFRVDLAYRRSESGTPNPT